MVEATWVGLDDYDRLKPVVQKKALENEDLWQGPVRGPLYHAFWLLRGVLSDVRDPSWAGWDASMLFRLAEFVVPNKGAFQAWSKVAITRVAKHHPNPYRRNDDEAGKYDDEEVWKQIHKGKVLSKEILDPGSSYEKKNAKRQLAALISRVDIKRNPFLLR